MHSVLVSTMQDQAQTTLRQAVETLKDLASANRDDLAAHLQEIKEAETMLEALGDKSEAVQQVLALADAKKTKLGRQIKFSK
jgi:ABC-type transporter Mla subunit MlaD